MKMRNILTYGLLALLAVLVLLPVAPNLQPVPAVDSSVFLYTGGRVLAGDIPYKDVWDHKGPLIYYIDALGLGVSGGSRWGVWLLELLFVVAAAWLAYRLMETAFGRLPAIGASGFFLLGLSAVLHGGNMTEEYALPFQFAALWFFFQGRKSLKGHNFFLIGVFAALSFSLRPNIIAIPLAIGIYYLWRALRARERGAWKRLGLMALGAAGVLAFAAAYFASQSALQDLWEAVIRYNLAYTATRSSRQLQAIATGLQLLPLLAALALAGWLTAISRLRRSKKKIGDMESLLLVLLIALPLEMILTSIASRDYQHYYMTWLPVLTLLAAFFVYFLEQQFSSRSRPVSRNIRSLAVTALLGAAYLPALPLLAPAAATLQAGVEAGGLPAVSFASSPYKPSLTYIYENTKADDYVLFWGNNLALQWITQRFSPTRFAYQSAFAIDGFVNEAMVAELISDLKAHPGLIIDTTINNDPVPALNQAPENVSLVLRPLFEYFRENYIEADALFKTDWVVYRYVGSNQ